MTPKTALSDYIIGLRHVGHVVEDLDAAVASFKRVYGIRSEAIRYLPNDDQAARFAFITVGTTEFELVQPVSDELRATIAAHPNGSGGINHVAWRVSDLDACLEILGQLGIGPGHVTPDGPIGFKNVRFVYLDPTHCDGLLIELVEIKDN